MTRSLRSSFVLVPTSTLVPPHRSSSAVPCGAWALFGNVGKVRLGVSAHRRQQLDHSAALCGGQGYDFSEYG